MRSASGEGDHIARYEALSYAWGKSDGTAIILCNGIEFPISENLLEAQRMLRRTHQQTRYLWVDAICINQNEDRKKAEQVCNMLTIYKKATRVIGWLGHAQEDIENALVAAASISPEPTCSS